MKVITILIFIIISLSSKSQSYEVYKISYYSNGYTDTNFVRNDSIFNRIPGGGYQFNYKRPFKTFISNSQITGFENVNNTSDLSKPISTATQSALDLKLATNGSAASLTNFPTLNQNTSGTAAGLSTPLSFANGGASGSAATSATTGTMTVSMTTRLITITPSGACTFNASGGTTGQIVTFIITTSGVSSFVLTWGTNFRKTGTLATGTTSARFFAVSFICVDGTIWQELSRTIVQS